MLRSHSKLKIKRCIKKTILIYGEGLTESIFLKYLRSLYSSDSGVSITIRAGRGGGVRSIVIDAAKEFAQLDRRVVVVDCDRGGKEMNLARREAK